MVNQPQDGKAARVAGIVIGLCIVAIIVAVTVKLIRWIVGF